jgi:hypothetical protein
MANGKREVMYLVRVSVLAVAFAASAFLASPSPASAAASCGSAVLSDWSDGRIDGEYPVSCYRSALSQMPEDLRVYGTARSDIVRALNSATTRAAAAASPAQSGSSSSPSGRPWTFWLAIAAVLAVAVPVSLRRFGP